MRKMRGKYFWKEKIYEKKKSLNALMERMGKGEGTIFLEK